MSIKQVPNYTVNIRVPARIFVQLDAEVRRRKDRGERASKNSLYIEALETYLYYLQEEREGEGEDDGQENEQEGDYNGAGGTVPGF